MPCGCGCQSCTELIEINWLGQKRVDSGTARRLGDGVKSISGNRDETASANVRLSLRFSKQLRDRETVEPRHTDVENDRIEGLARAGHRGLRFSKRQIPILDADHVHA